MHNEMDDTFECERAQQGDTQGLLEKHEERFRLSDCPLCPFFKQCSRDGYLDRKLKELKIKKCDHDGSQDRDLSSDKEGAARKAAAKYSTDNFAATIEFGRLTERVDLVTNDFKGLQKEMMDQLPSYRRPTSDKYIEYMVFFDPDCLSLDARLYQVPAFLDGMNGDQLEAAQQYVRESELEKIEAANSKNKLAELEDRLSRAENAYVDNRNERPDKRNVQVVQAIGLSRGVPQRRIDPKQIWFDYVQLIRKKGHSRQAALEITRRANGIISIDQTRRFLFEYRKTLLEKWTRACPSMVPMIKKRLSGLVPSKPR